MADEYVIQDRTLATKWAVQVDDGEFFYESTANAASSEPIIEDDLNSGTYWTIFIDDGELGYESTVTVQDDEVDLDDSSLNVTWRLSVYDGQFRIVQVSIAVRLLLANKSRRVLNTVKSALNVNTVKSRLTS